MHERIPDSWGPGGCTFCGYYFTEQWVKVADTLLVTCLLYDIIFEITKYSEYVKSGCQKPFGLFWIAHFLNVIFYRLFHYLERYWKYCQQVAAVIENRERELYAGASANLMSGCKFSASLTFLGLTLLGTMWLQQDGDCLGHYASRLVCWLMLSYTICFTFGYRECNRRYTEWSASYQDEQVEQQVMRQVPRQELRHRPIVIEREQRNGWMPNVSWEPFRSWFEQAENRESQRENRAPQRANREREPRRENRQAEEKKASLGLTAKEIRLIRKYKLRNYSELKRNSDNRTPNTRNVGIKRKLESKHVEEDSSSEIDTTCTVCIESVRINQWYKQLPKCGHFFHAKCIDQWLEMRATCPVCREAVIGNESEGHARRSRSRGSRSRRARSRSPRRVQRRERSVAGGSTRIHF